MKNIRREKMNKTRYSISEASRMVGVESHVLRYWEDELQLEVPRNGKSHRYYTELHIRLFQKIKELKEKGIGLYIVSGSIIEGIELVLGENVKYFDKIIANHFVFDKKGVISRINATKYDYEGKSVFASELIKKLDISPKELCFIGNGDNDEWVYKTGCRTICINPDGADFSNTVKWSRCIQQSDDFRDLLPIIESLEEENERE